MCPVLRTNTIDNDNTYTSVCTTPYLYLFFVSHMYVYIYVCVHVDDFVDVFVTLWASKTNSIETQKTKT